MNERVYELLCKTWQARYPTLLELIDIFNTTVEECIVHKDMVKNSVINVTFDKDLYFSNAFYVFRNYYLASLPITVLEEVLLRGDMYTLQIDFKNTMA